MKRKLKQLDEQIKQWKEIANNYPLCEGYKMILLELMNERDILASFIGKKK